LGSPDHVDITAEGMAVDWVTAELLLVLASTLILGSEFYGTHCLQLRTGGSGSLPVISRIALECFVARFKDPV
jgi:hypothetical protein